MGNDLRESFLPLYQFAERWSARGAN
jgi:hypothetical protein